MEDKVTVGVAVIMIGVFSCMAGCLCFMMHRIRQLEAQKRGDRKSVV